MFAKKSAGVDGFIFSIGGIDFTNKESSSTIERFNVKLKIWETLKLSLPKKLAGLCAILDGENVLHCLGGTKDWHFSIPLERFYKKEGALMIFMNWFKECGFRGYKNSLGQLIDDYAGNIF